MVCWKPPVDNVLSFFDSYENYLESLPEERKKTTKMVKTHWPPDNVGGLHLDRWFVNRSPFRGEYLTSASA